MGLWVPSPCWNCVFPCLCRQMELSPSMGHSLVMAKGWWPAARLGHWACACMGPFEGGCHYPHCPQHSLVSGQKTGREHNHVHQQKIGLKIYWERLCPSEQDPVPPTVSLSHQVASISLLPLSIRGQTEWDPKSQKTNKTDHLDHSLVWLNETMSHDV